MARTVGATNKTPRELRLEAKRLTERADYLEKIEKLNKQIENDKGDKSNGR
ncbi:MAG: hypothetical protein SOI66_00035 [Bifidobacterium sp.]|jgi:hypothetical protein